jgi:nucleotide-binding universal stress UspA family protein
MVGFAAHLMRALVWITESRWEGCVDRASALLPPEAEVTLLHVASTDVEQMASGGGGRLLGRRPPPPHDPPLRAIADEEAHSLLQAARARLGRSSTIIARRGRVEREVLEASAGADVLLLARDGRHQLGPGSLGKRARFVVDHAPCQVLLVWADEPPRLDAFRWPPHLR